MVSLVLVTYTLQSVSIWWNQIQGLVFVRDSFDGQIKKNCRFVLIKNAGYTIGLVPMFRLTPCHKESKKQVLLLCNECVVDKHVSRLRLNLSAGSHGRSFRWQIVCKHAERVGPKTDPWTIPYWTGSMTELAGQKGPTTIKIWACTNNAPYIYT